MEPKLYTMAEISRILADFDNGNLVLGDVLYGFQQRGLIAPEPVGPLLKEARKVIAEHLDAIEDAQAVLVGENDGWATMKITLAALRRGMELQREAQPALTREAVRKALQSLRWNSSDYYVDAFCAALTQPPHAGEGVGHG